MTTGRAAILTGGRPVRLPDHPDGWRWEPYAVDGTDVEAARQQLQRLMRHAEADIAEALSNEGWLTVLDGPLHGIRHHRSALPGNPGAGRPEARHPLRPDLHGPAYARRANPWSVFLMPRTRVQTPLPSRSGQPWSLLRARGRPRGASRA